MAGRPRVYWAGEAEGNAKFDIDDTWDDVRRYIRDDRVKGGLPTLPEHIHVRPRFARTFLAVFADVFAPVCPFCWPQFSWLVKKNEDGNLEDCAGKEFEAADYRARVKEDEEVTVTIVGANAGSSGTSAEHAAPFDPSHVSMFWQFLLKTKFGVDALHLPKGVFMLGNPSSPAPGLIVRDCYPAFLQLVIQHPRTTILGTPGIGKTLFSAYLLWHLAQHRQTVVYQPFIDDKEKVRFLLEPTGACTVGTNMDFSTFLQDPDTWYLLDASRPMEYIAARTILVTSPRKSIFHSWSKQVQAAERYMPVWTNDEIVRCCKTFGSLLPVTLTRAQTRFKRVGGSARLIFSTYTDSELRTKMEHAISSANLTSIIKAVSGDPSGDPIADQLIHIQPSADYIAFQYVFPSASLGQELSETFARTMRQDVIRFVQASDNVGIYGSLRGTLFEGLAHNTLSSGAACAFRPAGTPWNGTSTLSLGPCRVVTYKELSQVNLTPGEYYRPLSLTQAAVDSIAYPYFFQFTVGERHDIIAARFKEIVSSVNYQGVPELVFVVPRSMFDHFKVQNFVGVNGTSLKTNIPKANQYVLAIDHM